MEMKVCGEWRECGEDEGGGGGRERDREREREREKRKGGDQTNVTEGR
jgi:hypothetical protein